MTASTENPNISPDAVERADAEDATNDYIRRVVRGNAPYISIPYVDRDGRSAVLAIHDDTPHPVSAETHARVSRILEHHAAPESTHTLPTPTPAVPLSTNERGGIVAGYITAQVRGGTDPAALTVRVVAKATGIPHATVNRLDVWSAFETWRETTKVGQIRTRQLTAEMLAVVADRAATDPAEAAATNDELARLIAEQKRDDNSRKA